MDLDVEHDNKYFKNDCHSYRGEFTEKTINRIGRSTERSNQIVMNFHQTTSAAKPSGVHSRLSTEGDVKALVEHVYSACQNSFIVIQLHITYSRVTKCK